MWMKYLITIRLGELGVFTKLGQWPQTPGLV